MEKKFTIENFKITQFSNLLKESLMTNSSLMLNFSDGMIKSASFSKTKSLMKMWQIPISKLINDESELDSTLVTNKQNLEELDFNFYILKGELFMKFLDVFKSSTVTIEFTLNNDQAVSVKFTGKTETKYYIETVFPLTHEEMIMNKVDDYSVVIDQCTPENDMFNVLFTQNYYQEIKKLVKNLHSIAVDNSAYLTFTITKDHIKVNDNVFDVDFPNIEYKNIGDNDSISFNVLKSDFLLLGEHNFIIFTDNTSQKIIMNCSYNSSIICCVCTKVGNQQIIIDEDDDELTAFDISNYDLGDFD